MDENKNLYTDLPPLEIEKQKKEKDIKEQKRIFILWVSILVAFLTLTIIGAISLYIYKQKFAVNIPPVIIKPEEPSSPINPTSEPTILKTTIYKSDNLKLSLEYPNEAKVVDTWPTSTQSKKLEIFFQKGREDYEGIKDTGITDGYIFRVSAFTANVRSLDEIAKVKKEGMASNCFQTSEFSDTTGISLDGIEGRTFEVRNCNGDSVIIYLPKFGLFYEFAQIYRGDIGYKQLYRAATLEILNSIRLYPEQAAPVSPTDLVTYKEYGFSFEHPKMDSQCCNIPNPPAKDAQQLLVLGDTETFADKNNFDGIGIFVVRTGSRFTGYDNFMDNEKKALIDDYVVVRGTQPTLEEKTIKLGDRDATLLRGFSWQNNDLIYLDMTGEGNAILILSVKNISGEKFEEKLDTIYSSFKFFKQTY